VQREPPAAETASKIAVPLRMATEINRGSNDAWLTQLIVAAYGPSSRCCGHEQAVIEHSKDVSCDVGFGHLSLTQFEWTFAGLPSRKVAAKAQLTRAIGLSRSPELSRSRRATQA